MTNTSGKTAIQPNNFVSGLFNSDLFKKQTFSLSEVLSTSDVDAIKAYNEQIDNCVTSQTAFNRTMLNTSKDAQNVVAAANGNKVALDGLTKSSKAAELGMKALAMAGNMLLIYALTSVVDIIYKCATASDRLAESAAQMGSEFASTKSDISDYKTKIEELYQIINDDTSSYEDTYNARQELLKIQDEMIDKFGDEADAVKLVTDAINGQTDSLDTLTQDKWQETVNAFNSDSGKGWTEKVADAFANIGHGNNFQRMIDEMEDTKVTFHMIPMYGDDTYEEFSKKLKEDFGADITRSERDDAITLSGDLDTIYKQLLNIQTLAKGMGIDDTFLKDLGDQADEAKGKLDEYQEMYSQHVLYDKIFNSEDYEKSFDEINKAYEKYQDAFASGDEETIEKAKQNYAEIVQSAIKGLDDQSVIDYFNNMYPDLQEVVGGWEFEVKFKAAVDDDSDDFEKGVQDAVSKFDTVEDIKNYNPKVATDEQKDAYLQLKQYADDYGLTLDQLIDKLVQLGLLQSQSKSDLLNKLIPSKSSPTAGVASVLTDTMDGVDADEATKWVESLTEEEAKLANSKDFENALEEQKKKLNGASLSADDYAAALQAIKDKQNENSEETPTSFSTLFDGSDFGDRISYLSQQFQNGKISAHDYFESIRNELANTDFSEFTNQAAAAQQFFTDSTQQVASGMSDLINSYNKGEISATEYLEGYTSMAETLSALTDDLQNNSAAWNENGEAISDGTNQALDNAQSDLASAIEGINQYQDSIYSLEQITSGAITAGSDEFTAHAQVIAEDLAYIVQNGGYMADQIASTMGTTTSEIANSLTNSVDNQALASQAIAGNTNASIEQMANAVSTLFAELGNQIGNFKATINFAPKVNGVEHFSAIKIGGKEIVGGDIPNLTYDINGSSSSLKSIGSAISSFGKVLSSNIAAQKVDYKKFSTTPTDSSGKQRSYTPSKGVTNDYNNKLKNNKSSGKSGSGGSGGNAEKQNEEYLDKFMAYQKARLEAGKITYQQYSQYVSNELERMYKNGEISASKYYSAVKDMINEQKSIYDAALKGVIKLLDDEIDKWQDKIDAIEKSNDKLNEQKDKYDSILSAIQKVYDDEIEKANKRKDSIQDIIDAMSDENDEYERQKKLQEAIYNLNKANSQKTKYLLKDGQFVYSTDDSAIRDAQDSLHDAQYDVDVANLKKQQDDIDNYIDTLNEFKDKWNEISDAFSEAQDTMNLKQYLGSEYQRIILSNNLADIENFKNQYVAVESQINSNEQLKTSYEEKVDYYNNLKQQWEDCTSKYDDEMNKLYASQILGANWESEVLSGRLQTLTNFTSEYEKLCQRQADAAVNAANTEVQASKNAAAGVTSTSSSVASSGSGSSSGGSSSSTSSAPKVTYDKNNNPNKPNLVSNDYWTYEKLSKGYSTSGQASSHISDYASKGANGFTQIGNKYFIVKWIANAGTPANASKAKNKLEKDHPKKIGKYGYAKRYHKGLELGKIEALPKDKAFDLVQDIGTNGLEADEVPIIAKKGEAVLTEEQIENLAKTLHLVPVQNELMEKMSKISLGDLPMNTPKMNFDASKIGQSVTKNNFAPSVTLNLNCPNVSSVSDAKAITDVVDKQLNKFANDFYQASLHYVNKK